MYYVGQGGIFLKGRQIDYRIQNYVKEHFSLYIFAIILFIMGVIFGSMIVHSLSPDQKQEMITYISKFFHGINQTDQWMESKVAFRQVVFEYLKYLFLLWFLGLSIIGMPFILILLFMKGFMVGFTISFLIAELQWKGFLFSFVAILPQNLLIVPVIIIAGVAGISFSLSLIRARGQNRIRQYQQPFISYSFLMLILGGVLIFASGFESYVSPWLMKSVTTFLVR